VSTGCSDARNRRVCLSLAPTARWHRWQPSRFSFCNCPARGSSLLPPLPPLAPPTSPFPESPPTHPAKPPAHPPPLSTPPPLKQSSNAPGHIAVLKGAPEVVRGFLAAVPADYDATYKRFAAQVWGGGRKIARAQPLIPAYEPLPHTDPLLSRRLAAGTRARRFASPAIATRTLACGIPRSSLSPQLPPHRSRVRRARCRARA
jgi:hypothetical protein